MAAVLGALLMATGVHLIVRDPVVHAETFGTPEALGAPQGDMVGEQGAPTPGGQPHGPASVVGPRPPTAPSPDPAPDPKPDGAAAPAAPRASVPPASVSFAASDVRADVVPVGVLASGALQVPKDPAVVGWWVAGAVPGAEEGTVVLAGHMDGQRQSGAMSVLLKVSEGDVVEVADHAGAVHSYRVSARSATPRDDLDETLFTRTGPHRLVLITCGGRFDQQSGLYEDNIVVVADPLP